MKILVTDGSYKNSLAVIRALGECGHDVYAVGGRYCLANLSRFCRQGGFCSQDFGPFGSVLSEGLLDEFIDHINRACYDLIIPVGGKSVELLSTCRSQLEVSSIILPAHSSIELALDKRRTAVLANSLSIRTPKEYCFGSVLEVEKAINEIEFPVVVKSSNELQKYQTSYFYNKRALVNHLKHFEARRILNKWSFPIIQQYISGKGVGYFGVFWQGSVISQFMHMRIRETPPEGGASSCAKSIFMKEIEAQGRKILGYLNWSGPAMVEFKLSESDGQLYLMEINPKLWGSLDLAIICGVNIPADIVCLLGDNKQLNDTKSYTLGKLCSWPLDGEVRHVLENPKALVRVLFDTFRPSVANNLRLSDIKPAVLSLFFSFRAITMHFVRKSGVLRFISLSRNIGLRLAVVRLWTEKTGVPIKGYCKIENYLYVGQQQKIMGIKRLKNWNIKLIISLRAEFDDEDNGLCFCDYSYLPVVEFQPIPFEVLAEGVSLIEKSISKRQSVYIHCAEGVSRAPTLAAAYLVTKGLSVDTAILEIKKHRPFINILDGQLKALQDFETRYTSNLVDASC